MGLAAISPISVSASPQRKAMVTEVCTPSLTLSDLSCPINPASTTLVPIESPINRLRSVVMSGAHPPTAAMDCSSTKRPIMAMSAALKNC